MATEALSMAGPLVTEPAEPALEPPGRLSAPWATKTPEPLAPTDPKPLARITSPWPLPVPDPELLEPELDPVPVPSLPWVGIVMSVGLRPAAARVTNVDVGLNSAASDTVGAPLFSARFDNEAATWDGRPLTVDVSVLGSKPKFEGRVSTQVRLLR